MDPIHSAIAELQAEVHRLRNQASQSRPKPALPDPEKFNGQAYKYDTWLPSIKAKLRVDGAAIGDSVAQFYYVYLNLDSHVQAMVLPQLNEAEELQLWNYTTILDQLSRVYDNPNKIQEAEDKLFSLKQGTDSIPAYIAKFERILYEARGQKWPDVNKISTFRNGLNTTIRGRLSQQLNLPRTYPDFIKIVQQLAGRSSLYTPGNSSGNHSEPMDLGAINTIETNAISAETSSSRQEFLHSELVRLEKYCVRCRSHGHEVEDCIPGMMPIKESYEYIQRD